MTLAELHRRSAIALLDAALAHQGAGENMVSQPLLINSFIKKPVDDNLVSISMQLATSWRHLAHPRHALSACRGVA